MGRRGGGEGGGEGEGVIIWLNVYTFILMCYFKQYSASFNKIINGLGIFSHLFRKYIMY